MVEPAASAAIGFPEPIRASGCIDCACVCFPACGAGFARRRPNAQFIDEQVSAVNESERTTTRADAFVCARAALIVATSINPGEKKPRIAARFSDPPRHRTRLFASGWQAAQRFVDASAAAFQLLQL